MSDRKADGTFQKGHISFSYKGMNAGKHNSVKTEFKKGMKPWNANRNIELECQYCKTRFSVPIFRRDTAKFCKLVCKQKGVKSDPWKNKTERTHTQEARDKISKYQRDNPRRGENIYNWKGGTGTERHQAMGKYQYKEWRLAVFIRDDYTCQVCLVKGMHLNADHIEKWADNPELRYEVSNGRTLCRACHYYVTFKQKMPATSKWGLTTVKGATV